MKLTNTNAQKYALTSTILTIPASVRNRVFRVWADRSFHILASRTENVITTENSAPVSAMQELYVDIPSDHVTELLIFSGEPSGSVWIVEV